MTSPNAASPAPGASGTREKLLKFIAPWKVPALAVVTAMALGAILIAVAGGDPLSAYSGMFEGSLGSPRAIAETLVWSTPYILTGLSVALAFQGGLFNIGAEGQLALGAVFAALVGYGLPGLVGGSVPGVLHVPLTILAGGLAGAAWAGIPGWLKARTGAHEVISTIMLNYVALNAVSFLLNGPMKDPAPDNVIARTPLIADSASLSPILSSFRLHWGFPLALLAAWGVAWMLKKTTLGFEIRTVGANPEAARYSGMHVGRTIVVSMALSGALAGAAGAIEVSALNHRHQLGFSQGYGFDAIAIALLGKTKPAGVVPAALLFGMMRSGAPRMQFLTQIPVDVISVIQALILLFVAADVMVRRLYRLKGERERVVITRGWGS
ncbi:ABC transporter permease [Pendulispora brunnea]|uniref:ABC transporter permease n=1 Tax=Pendulispora brunnea TaxID=2905690 RepID=A0ABZ2K4I4_9BACT